MRNVIEKGTGVAADLTEKPASLNTLYGWPDEPYDKRGGLVDLVQATLQKPLVDLDEEDVRFLIGQHFCLDYLMPNALDRLEHEPFADVAWYAGELLHVCLRVDMTFWVAHPELRSRLEAIAMRLITDDPEQLNEIAFGNTRDEIKDFLNSYAS